MERLREKGFDLVNISQEEKDRRAAFQNSFVSKRTGEEILQILEENEKKTAQS